MGGKYSTRGGVEKPRIRTRTARGEAECCMRLPRVLYLPVQHEQDGALTVLLCVEREMATKENFTSMKLNESRKRKCLSLALRQSKKAAVLPLSELNSRRFCDPIGSCELKKAPKGGSTSWYKFVEKYCSRIVCSIRY